MSGLRDIVLGAIYTAFGAIDDLKTTVVYIRKAKTYDPSTGDMVGSDTPYTITNAAVVQFKNKEIDGDIVKTNDCKVLFPGDSLTFDPDLADTMTFNGKTWNIKNNLPAPKGLLNVVHVREK